MQGGVGNPQSAFLKNKIRGLQAEGEMILAYLTDLRHEVRGSESKQHLNDVLKPRFDTYLRNLRQVIAGIRTTEQGLQEIATSQSDYAHIQRLQSITDSLISRQTRLTTLVNAEIDAKAQSAFLFDNPTNRGSPGDARSLLGQEGHKLEESIAILQESINTGKSAMSNLKAQSYKLKQAGTKARHIFTSIKTSDVLIGRIRRMETRNRVILSGTTALCTLFLFFYAIR